jgi:hypothetical protein
MPEEKKRENQEVEVGVEVAAQGGTDALAMAARVWGVGVGGAVVLVKVKVQR